MAKSLQSCPTLCDPIDGSHQAPPSLGFSRQEHWSGLPFPSPMHDSEKWKWSCSVVSDSQRPHGLQPTRLLHPWDFPAKSTGVGCHCLLHCQMRSDTQLSLGYICMKFLKIWYVWYNVISYNLSQKQSNFLVNFIIMKSYQILTLTILTWQPRGLGWGGKWKAGLRGKGRMYTCGWFMLVYGRDQHNIVIIL